MAWREIEHTADWAIEVTAPHLPGLFRDAAAGLYGLAGCELGNRSPDRDEICVEGPDVETLLVSFLDELLFQLEVHRVAHTTLVPRIDGEELSVITSPVRVVAVNKEIKAVTFHDLEIVQTDDGNFHATVVFDV